MKLHILSDLHLSVGALEPPRADADVVVLAGDIMRPAQAVAWARQFTQPVIYVLGNHEFYGGSLDGTVAEFRRLCAGTSVHLLDDEALVIDGVRFLGSTLWTDFRLFDDEQQRQQAMAQAQELVHDFLRIRLHDGSDELFSPAAAAARFARHAAWLDQALDVPHAGPTVVITHHAPSTQSIHPRFAGSPLNACFVSDAEYLLRGQRTALWIHGHTHDSFDYQVDGTRVICNARGYAKTGVNENARFDPLLTLEVG